MGSVMLSKRDRFHRARNYVLYYGHEKTEQMQGFDIAIVEPSGQSPDAVRKLQDTGTLVIAYLSVMEAYSWMPELKLLNEHDFLQNNGQALINPTFNTYIMDLHSERWTSMLIHNTGRLLIQYGYDGLFLDTIGDLESPEIPLSLQNTQLSAAIQFLGRLRKDFSSSILIQNNGLERLCMYSAGLIDGICWENPPFEKMECAGWTKSVLGRLDSITQKNRLRTMLLFEEPAGSQSMVGVKQTTSVIQQALDVARNINGLLYFAPQGYTAGINPPCFPGTN